MTDDKGHRAAPSATYLLELHVIAAAVTGLARQITTTEIYARVSDDRLRRAVSGN